MLDYPVRLSNFFRWRDGDETFLFNPRNNIVLSTSSLFNDLLDCCEKFDRNQIVEELSRTHSEEQCVATLERLDRLEGQLQLIANPLVKPAWCTSQDIDRGIVDTLTLTLTHTCNLQCDYCFDGLNFMHSTSSMTKEVARAAIEFLFGELGDRRKCKLIFTGGEPLLNWPVLVFAVDFAKEMGKKLGVGVSFLLKTNGTLVGPRELDFFENNCFTAQVSIDGEERDHDRSRKDCRGVGSFDRAVAASRQITERLGAERSEIRATITRQNARQFGRNIRYLAELGAGTLSVGFVMVPESSPFGLRSEDIEAFQNSLLDLVLEISSAPDSEGCRRLLDAFRGGRTAGGFIGAESRVAKYGCGAGLWHLCVDADGAILPCYRLSGEPGYQMGNVCDPDISEIRAVQHVVLPRYNRDEVAKCRKCWAQRKCSLSCVAQRLLSQSEDDPICGEVVVQSESLLKAAIRPAKIRNVLPRI